MQRLWVVPLAVMVIVMGPRSLASQKNPIQSSRILRTRTLNRRRSPRSATASVVTFSKLNSSMDRYTAISMSRPLYCELIFADSKARYYDKNIRGNYRSLRVRTRQKEQPEN